MDKVPMTDNSYNLLEEELKTLKSEDRPNVIKAIAEAREHGDLSEMDYIAVEDTRVSKKLLTKFNINIQMLVYNNFNESKQVDKIVDLLKGGNNIALISDAGTPCISDPGYLLVNSCKINNIKVTKINKVSEGRPHLVDAIKDGLVNIIFNTTEGEQSIKESFSLRRAALSANIPYYTTLAGSKAATEAIISLNKDELKVKSIQSY